MAMPTSGLGGGRTALDCARFETRPPDRAKAVARVDMGLVVLTVPTLIASSARPGLADIRATGFVFFQREISNYGIPRPTVNIDDAAARLEALGHPTRLLIYRALVRAGEPGLPVGGLQSMLDVGPSTLSHHLKTLLVVGLIVRERRGTSLICRTNDETMDALVAFLVAECRADGGGVTSATGPR